MLTMFSCAWGVTAIPSLLQYTFRYTLAHSTEAPLAFAYMMNKISYNKHNCSQICHVVSFAFIKVFMNSKFISTTNKKVKEYFQYLVWFRSIKSTYVIHEYSSTCNVFLTMSLEIWAKLWAPDVAISFCLPQLTLFLLLNVCNHITDKVYEN